MLVVTARRSALSGQPGLDSPIICHHYFIPWPCTIHTWSSSTKCGCIYVIRCQDDKSSSTVLYLEYLDTISRILSTGTTKYGCIECKHAARMARDEVFHTRKRTTRLRQLGILC
eukprot:COSAG06_NODE_1403_length_9565_cov_3.285231_3_plen_114_part_00